MSDLRGVKFNSEVMESSSKKIIVPQGKYKAILVGDTFSTNKKQTGKTLKLIFKIIEKDFFGINLDKYLSIVHNNIQAQDIAQGELKRICTVCGVKFPIVDTNELIGVPIILFVNVEKKNIDVEDRYTGEYKSISVENNIISGYDMIIKEEIKEDKSEEYPSDWDL
jgi:hypothetical protein